MAARAVTPSRPRASSRRIGLMRTATDSGIFGRKARLKKGGNGHVSQSRHINWVSGGDPEARFLSSGQQVANFSLATDESYVDKNGERREHVEWHNVVAFAKLAEICKEYLKKGRQVYVEGRLRTREYEARNGGGKRQRTEIVALRVQFLGPPPAGKTEASAVDEPPVPTDSDIPF
jgi:single-strand DNA-binding protein